MADKILLKDEAPPIHEAGQVAAICCDVIDLGKNVEQFEGNPPEVKDKLALVFRTEDTEDGKPRYIAQEFTTTMGRKGNLRKFLESWRGKAYTEEEARKQGIPLDKLEGAPALVTIAHKTSRKGNEYAYILSIAPLPKQMRDAAPKMNGYERPEFWTKKKAEYAEAAQKFYAAHGNGGKSAGGSSDGEFADYPEAIDNSDDDLPF